MENKTMIIGATAGAIGIGALAYFLMTSRPAEAQPTQPTQTDCSQIDASAIGRQTVYMREPQNWPVIETFRGVHIYQDMRATLPDGTSNPSYKSYHFYPVGSRGGLYGSLSEIRGLIDRACTGEYLGCPTCQYGANEETVPYGWQGRTIGEYGDVYGAYYPDPASPDWIHHYGSPGSLRDHIKITGSYAWQPGNNQVVIKPGSSANVTGGTTGVTIGWATALYERREQWTAGIGWRQKYDWKAIEYSSGSDKIKKGKTWWYSTKDDGAWTCLTTVRGIGCTDRVKQREQTTLTMKTEKAAPASDEWWQILDVYGVPPMEKPVPDPRSPDWIHHYSGCDCSGTKKPKCKFPYKMACKCWYGMPGMWQCTFLGR